MINLDKLNRLVEQAYLLGFSQTTGRYNQEYPFKNFAPVDDPDWVRRRDIQLNLLKEHYGFASKSQMKRLSIQNEESNL